MAFERIAAALSPAAARVPALLATLAAVVLWGAVAALAFRGLRRRDLFWVVPFGLFTLLSFAGAEPSVGLALVVALPVVARWRWPQECGRRTAGWAILGALVVPLLAFLPVPGGRAEAAVPLFALARFVAWARELTGLYLLLALPGLIRAWSLSIRRVGRRLALLLVLSGVVPVLLLSLMWSFTTLLGVRAERALFATRLIERAGGDLRTALAVAHAAPAPGRDPLLALAAAHGDWPGLRLWRDGRRVHGGPVPQESVLTRWPDSLPQSGLVVLGQGRWLGARAAGPAGAVAALVPIEQVLGSDIGPLVGARLEVQSDLVPDSVAAGPGDIDLSEDPAAGLDSLGSRLGRGGTRDGAVQLSVSGRRVIAADRFSFSAGHALLDGIAWRRDRWERNAGGPRGGPALARRGAGSLPERGREPAQLRLAVLHRADRPAAASWSPPPTSAWCGRWAAASPPPCTRCGHGAGRLEAGDLDHRIAVEGDDELWDVAGAFNRMAVGLERGRRLEIERQRIESELGLARRIQARLLPPGPPAVPGLELAGTSESAREVGGDYYDFLPLGRRPRGAGHRRRLGQGRGRGTAHVGLPRLAHEPGPGAASRSQTVLARLNRFLHHSVEPGKFVTAFLGVLDGASGRLVYSNAGHNAPLVIGADGAVTRLEAGGLILGIFEDAAYETGEVTLAPGDRLVLFTDGVTEAMDERDEQWGEERLVELVRSGADLDGAALVARIVEAVRRFEGGRGASDDVTLIVARRTGG